jgi:ribosomal protein S18 acetylase RimI-like enzyme
MDIGELTPADRDAATGLWDEAGLTRPWNDPARDFDRALCGPMSSVLGGFEAGELAATVMVGHDGHRGWVYYLAVRHAHRRRGLGRRMMQEAESWLRARGAVKLHLMVRTGNPDTLGFYRKIGYEDSDVRVLARWLVDPGLAAQCGDARAASAEWIVRTHHLDHIDSLDELLAESEVSASWTDRQAAMVRRCHELLLSSTGDSPEAEAPVATAPDSHRGLDTHE